MKPTPARSDSSSLDLTKLVMHLRASGFQTDTRQFLTAHQYLMARADHGQPLGELADPLMAQSLISSLGPIFCNSPEEQERFEGILMGLYRVAAPKP
ncbi:MAG: hypothetical protein KJP06_07500, partial [Deltaproteobacteria bacterium]|nr:hypothetical protein [Deltaproteobacteria bacterium]